MLITLGYGMGSTFSVEFVNLPRFSLPNIPFSTDTFLAISDLALDLTLVNTKKRHSKKEYLVVRRTVPGVPVKMSPLLIANY